MDYKVRIATKNSAFESYLQACNEIALGWLASLDLTWKIINIEQLCMDALMDIIHQ